ncbi:hypothetical protein WICPIJ_007493 [Wickerhamomyces pijperi]|uniref:mitogen-activated protein kinase kinase n=1 Tax=Wickerhamomyces pijperi TaxID=599730 RepID=A0A9P8Q051_WICPI|nr:hypothetical protein WICPIJ_007493 [Wickerhamomyces pijperi]
MSHTDKVPIKEVEDLHLEDSHKYGQPSTSSPITSFSSQGHHDVTQTRSPSQNVKPVGGSSIPYPHISPDIQAKLQAFHEQRSKGPVSPSHPQDIKNSMDIKQTLSQPVLSRKNSIKKEMEMTKGKEEKMTNSPLHSESNNDGTPRDKTNAEKPLPPLPPSVRKNVLPHNSIESLKKTRALNPPARPAPSLPNSDTTSTIQKPISSAAQIPIRAPQKQSLSMRRGLKFPGGLPSLSEPAAQGQPNARSTNTDQPKLSLPLSNSEPPQSKSSVSRLIDRKGKLPAQQSMQLKGLFANYSKYIDIKSGSLKFAGKLSLDSTGVDFSTGSSFRISSDELELIEEIGRGNYGTVSKVLHKPTGVTMAMKEVRLELDESKFRQILMELEVLHKCNSPYIVDFYGAFFVEGAVYMCIEYMDGGSLDNIYGDGIDEDHLAYITESVIKGLLELKENHNIIHRDVKPTNILVSTSGKVKLCDFGVSGNLVASLARTNIGCQSYMAPERIKSLSPDDSSYSVQSDIWSLGLTILETAKGCYPYPPETYDNIFSQLSAIVDGEPPALPESFSALAKDFVSKTLDKQPNKRPTYQNLLKHEWLTRYDGFDFKMAEYFKEKIRLSNKTHKSQPALHTGGANNLNS